MKLIIFTWTPPWLLLLVVGHGAYLALVGVLTSYGWRTRALGLQPGARPVLYYGLNALTIVCAAITTGVIMKGAS